MIACASVDFPDPDSPTTASVWPSSSVKLAPSTARATRPGPSAYSTLRSRTSRRWLMGLTRRDPAVDDHRRPGDPAGFLAGEEQHQAGHVGRLPDPAERHLRVEPLPDDGIGHVRRDDRGVDRPGADA